MGLPAPAESGWQAWSEGGAHGEERAGQGGFLGVELAGGARLRFPWGAELPLEREAMLREVARHWEGGGRVRAQTWLLHIEVLSKTPEGAPVRTDEVPVAPGEIDAALAMAREAIEAVSAEERAFQQRFERAARDLTAEMLAGSEATVRGSLAQYGIELGPVLEKAIEREGGTVGQIGLDVLENPFQSLGQEMVGRNPALHAGTDNETESRTELAAAAQDLRTRAAELAGANAENDRLQVEVQRRRGGVCHASHHGPRPDRPDFSHLAAFPAPELTLHGRRFAPADEPGLDVQATGSARRVERLTGELGDAWRRHEARHPVLAAYRDGGGYPTEELDRLGGSADERHRELVRVSFERLCAIAKARQAVTSGEVSVFELPRVLKQTRARLDVEPGSVQDAFIGNAVADASDPEWLAWVLTALSFASVLLAPATVGSTAAFVFDLGFFTADVWFAIDVLEKQAFASAAALTDYDPDRALGDADDSSSAPLVAALVAAGLGGLQIVHHVTAAGRRAGTAMAGDTTHLGPPHLLALGAGGAEAVATYPRVVRLSSQSWVDGLAAATGGPETLALLDSLLALEEAGRIRGATVWLARAEQRAPSGAAFGLDRLGEAHRLALAHPGRVVKLGSGLEASLVPVTTRADYMDVPPTGDRDGWTFDDDELPGRPGEIAWHTEAVAPNEARGEIVRAYHPGKSQLDMNEVFFDSDLPRSIGSEGEKGHRTVTFLTARQMRRMGIEYGELKTVKMSTIQNVVAVCQLDWLLRKGVPLDEAVLRTHSVAYAEGAIDLSGHRIVRARVAGGTTKDFDARMLGHFETRRFLLPPDPDIVALHDRILSAYGVRRSDPVLWNYDIYLDVQPISAGAR